ncbi:hypothetical protein CO174_04025 [Candidatus Uhrbacteria bacterium CG_4_9_14_3_um_filter_50_9]|uniref:Uncharacterized protein n=1 Tax=Candidatus Uhrbacteria bacterium CG_4_9_14_3_um_filter_50_9 TaxID=1975035 RepID=A0A2M7XBJ9_9BACT|nr:MAG: hypothetical protein CO174_04025 [Candidatus Uhrbacteria bacterium CG_4_9_14_3_um_filter_50_9]
MRSKIVFIGTIAITAFIPWLLLLAGLSQITELSRLFFIVIHYLMNMALFAIAFGWYFKGHQKEDPFRVMAVALVCLVVFELVYFGFIYEGELWFLTYVDWIIPAFLVATSIYGVGKLTTHA